MASTGRLFSKFELSCLISDEDISPSSEWCLAGMVKPTNKSFLLAVAMCPFTECGRPYLCMLLDYCNAMGWDHAIRVGYLVIEGPGSFYFSVCVERPGADQIQSNRGGTIHFLYNLLLILYRDK